LFTTATVKVVVVTRLRTRVQTEVLCSVLGYVLRVRLRSTLATSFPAVLRTPPFNNKMRAYRKVTHVCGEGAPQQLSRTHRPLCVQQEALMNHPHLRLLHMSRLQPIRRATAKLSSSSKRSATKPWEISFDK
ncbi:hypothetical protein ANN_01998, partial [Periplaneta americana]